LIFIFIKYFKFICISFVLCSTVIEKPTIVRGPNDAIVQENSDVVFRCTASGEPEPTTAWRKENGVIPAHR